MKFNCSPVTISWLALVCCPVLASANELDCDRVSSLGVDGIKILQHEWVKPDTRVSASIPNATLHLDGHCLLQGEMEARSSDQPVAGTRYAIKFELRLPENWQQRFLYEGGGGLDGVAKEAIGHIRTLDNGKEYEPALNKGFAVVTSDSGHTESQNPGFGKDPLARQNYAHAAIGKVTVAAKGFIQAYYGRRPRYSYFMGCSKGGQEALQAMQSYGQEYDGIVAGAPAMHLPHAAIAQIHDVQAFAAIAPILKNGKPDLSQSFTPTDLALVTQGIAQQCSGQDGSDDQQVVQPEQCHFKPEVLQCRGEKNAQCLSTGQVTALKSIFDGTYSSSGKKIYAGFPYDMGISSPGWRTWKLGDGQRPSLNEVLGGGSLAQVFMTPPVDAIDVYTHSLDALNQAIYASSKDFPQSAVDLVETDDSELKDFRARQGKLILYHGLGDPVFSAFDTLDYFKRLGSRHGDRTKEFASLYLIPGMTHCGGGDYALDTFDTLEPIVTWVEKGQAPAKLTAQAGVRSGAKLSQGIQSRAVCPYPKTPHLVDPAHAENAAAFACE